MSLTDEVNDRGLVPTLVLLALSLGSANRGMQELFDVDLVTLVFGGYAGSVMLLVGVVGLVTLVELVTDLEVVPDDLRV
jgi:uncharacterized membrane protein YuzA (DUF378 family)